MRQDGAQSCRVAGGGCLSGGRRSGVVCSPGRWRWAGRHCPRPAFRLRLRHRPLPCPWRCIGAGPVSARRYRHSFGAPGSAPAARGQVPELQAARSQGSLDGRSCGGRKRRLDATTLEEAPSRRGRRAATLVPGWGRPGRSSNSVLPLRHGRAVRRRALRIPVCRSQGSHTPPLRRPPTAGFRPRRGRSTGPAGGGPWDPRWPRVGPGAGRRPSRGRHRRRRPPARG